MRGVTEAKGLGDVRTAISRRVRAAPRQQGTTYLEIYLLDKERQRLEQELSRLDQRRGRINERLGEISGALAALEQTAERARQEGGVEAGLPADGGRGTADGGPRSAVRGLRSATGRGEPVPGTKWRRMAIEY